MYKQSNILFFLIGLFSMVRVHLIGMIGISEIAMIIAGPMLFIINLQKMQRDGFSTMAWLFLATCVGCMISSFYNHTPFTSWSRGLATPLVLFCSFVTLYHLMGRNPDGFRWLILGWSLSGLLSFILHGGNVAAVMDSDSSNVTVTRMYIFTPVILAVVRCWYTRIPSLLSAGILFGMGLYVIVTSASGRSYSLTILAGAVLVWVGMKSVRKMGRIKKHFLLAAGLGVCLLGAAKFAYARAATSGWLGEASRLKYERQSRGGASTLKLLMAGRVGFFAGMYAAIERPIIGYGPWALDYDGIYEMFLAKYGSAEDYEAAVKNSTGEKIRLLPGHSHIVCFWTWYGICGLLVWLYVLRLLMLYFSKYVDVIPQWYGLFATLIPPFVWDIFFSPLTHRIEIAALLCALLYVRAVRTGRRRSPVEMERERRLYLP